MEGAGLVSLKALKWLWTLNPSFPSEDIPRGTVLPSATPQLAASSLTPSIAVDVDVKDSISDGRCVGVVRHSVVY